MANPLKLEGSNYSGGELQVGETRTWSDPKTGKPFTLTRTTRDYVYDLCDAYNDARSGEARDRGVEWYVAPNGELKIGFSRESTRENMRQAESRLETERARYLRHHLENHREAAE